jgi:hypothetical protein
MHDGSAACECLLLAAIEELRERLRRAGWLLGEACEGSLWQVNGRKGKSRLVVTGQTRAQAWYNACVAAGEGGRAASVQ